MKILICDDESKRSTVLVEAVRKARMGTSEELVESDFKDELRKLFKIVGAHLAPSGPRDRAGTRFDGVDVVIVDNNLSHLNVDGTRMTAESIAGYIRAFTTARYIVSVNKNPDLDFDLAFLVGDSSSKADLALDTRHLRNPALWHEESRRSHKNGFLPWYWPGLAAAADRRGHQVSAIKKALTKPALKALGFDKGSTTFLTRAAQGALSPNVGTDSGVGATETLKELTFLDIFSASERSIPVKAERDFLRKGLMKGKAHFAAVIARCVAADVDLWFRQHVVAPQEPLVDVPHLLARFPFLLGKNVTKLEAWNAAVRASKAPYGLDPKLYEKHIAAARFTEDAWVGRPCFWWTKLKQNEALNNDFVDANAKWPDAVFCEDSSTFVDRRRGSEPNTGEFLTELEGSWARRYVALFPDIKYLPRSRLAQ